MVGIIIIIAVFLFVVGLLEFGLYDTIIAFKVGIIVLIVGVVLKAVVKRVLRYRREKEHEQSEYYKSTGRSLKYIEHDKGTYGEYCTYQELRSFEDVGAKFLFNIYIPKEDGSTTEIDLLMISRKGIFVYESKNYSGWIFGSQNNRYWTQTLPSVGYSLKSRFYNPVKQNKNHIKHLESLCGKLDPYSLIVFSERCELMDVWHGDNRTKVIKRNEVYRVTKDLYDQSSLYISDEIINCVYEKLKVYCNVSEQQKEEHINRIKNKY